MYLSSFRLGSCPHRLVQLAWKSCREISPSGKGLGVLDYSIVPHVDPPDHPESAALGLIAQQYQRLGVPHTTLRDGEVLIVNGTTQFVCR
jgi:hypothetical protein